MELNGYRLLLPEGTLEYFALVDVKESVNEVVIYLEEKNIVPVPSPHITLSISQVSK